MLSLRALPFVVSAVLFPIELHAQQDAPAVLPPLAHMAEGQPQPDASPHGGLKLQTGGDGEIVLDFGDATRREVFARLFAGYDVEIEWRNQAYADARLQSRIKGRQADLARQLLASTNHIVTYDSSSSEPRLARIVILGSDPPSVTRQARTPLLASREAQPGEALRRFKAIDTVRRAIAAAQRR